MSVVPFSSPLSLSGNNVDLNYEKDSSSVSPLLFDYTLLNSIVDSNQFEKSLELYSLMLNNSFNEQQQQEKISFEILIKQFFKEYSQISSNDLKELFQIFENLHFHSFISSYDFILKQHYQSTSKIQFHLSDDDEEENSLKPDDVSSKKKEKINLYLFYLLVF